MRLKKLLVLSAFCLSFGSAMAAIVDGVRVKPVPSATQGFAASETTDTYFYLYNVDAQAFFTEGNSWGTQVSLGSTGLKAAFILDGEGPAYLFNDYSLAKKAWKQVFFDNENAMFVDHNGQANYRWGVEDNGETFRLYAAGEEDGNPGWDTTIDEETGEETEHPAYREGMYMGWVKGSSSTACVPYLPVADENCINWAFVDEEVYSAFIAEIAVYEAAEQLKKAIDEVSSKGFTETATYEALYANEAATKEELEKGIQDLNAAFVEWGKSHASVENPADMTSKIVNPHFDNGDCTTGWSGDAFGRGGAVADGAEHYSKNYDTYQKITDLTPGIYAIGVNGFYRSGGFGNGEAIKHWLAKDEASKYAKFYGKVGENYYEVPIANVFSGAQTEQQNVGDVEVTYTDPETEEDVTVYAPNTMVAGDHFFHNLNQYANKLLVTVDESGVLTFGVKKTTQIGEDWSLFDDFSLAYYGAGADACQLMLDETLKNLGEVTIDEGTVYTQAYLTAYTDAMSGEKTANNLEELNAVLGGLATAKDDLEKNIELWKTWQTNLEDAYTKYGTDSKYQDLNATGDLTDYHDMDMAADGGPGMETILSEHKLTNEELEAEIQKVADMVQAIIDELKATQHNDGDDMTDFITNPGFDEDKDINSGKAEGWTIDSRGGGNVTRGPLGQGNKDLMEGALGYMNYCFEAWHSSDFDVWQEITDLPKGMYQLDVQGYVRYEGEMSGNGDTAIEIWNRMGNEWDDNSQEIPASPISLYMNNAQSKFPNIFSDPKPEDKEYVTVEGWTKNTDAAGNDWPNSMGGAAQAFGWGLYKSTAYGLIAKKGDTFRIGVKGKTDKGWWCIFDSFKLTYRVPTAEMVGPILKEELEKLDLTQPMGSNVFEQVSKVKEAAQAAIASNDGEQMFDALVEVYNLSEAISTSVELFASLNTANENLASAISNSQAASATKSEANALNKKISDGIEGHSIADEEVEGLMSEIAEAVTKLGLPDGYENATDAKPVELAVIVNPSYDENLDGWKGTAAGRASAQYDGGATCAEIFGKDYDYYQEIAGLPEGTYKVTVQGFYRLGPSKDDYTSYIADPESGNHGFLYASAINGTDTLTSSKALTRLAAEANEGEVYDQYAYCKEPSEEGAGDGLFVANTMIGASYEFDGGKYNNEVFVKINAGDILRIGLKKTTNVTDNWTIWDNWQIFYYGKDSAQAADGDPSAIAGVQADAQTTEFFNLSGSRISKPGKGVAVMKQMLKDGSIKIQKVMIK